MFRMKDHIQEGAISTKDETDLYAYWRCIHCNAPLPQAGLGLAFWTRTSLLLHLSNCCSVPENIRLEAQIELMMRSPHMMKYIKPINRPK